MSHRYPLTALSVLLALLAGGVQAEVREATAARAPHGHAAAERPIVAVHAAHAVSRAPLHVRSSAASASHAASSNGAPAKPSAHVASLTAARAAPSAHPVPLTGSRATPAPLLQGIPRTSVTAIAPPARPNALNAAVLRSARGHHAPVNAALGGPATYDARRLVRR